MKISYTPVGTCSREINLEVNDGIITDISVVGGCNGNLKGICALTRGRRAEDVIATLEGITCNRKATSCPDQIAKALREALAAGQA